ncbi:hypothetical protein Aph01nite_81050 [Acrocarpospora phusangensis]|uniref:HTH gntR-type domain-containing protein n=1 Tax=Acrocarpospora phusangensis TaxID=1070424 RepID=A0A919UVW3_9ACTN|nr:hypothetical protein Aph01nite_81050 [Acrocarpospora phusangensis]
MDDDGQPRIRRRELDPEADRALYKQLADDIRTQIAEGELAPEQRLPAEKFLGQIYGVSRDTVRQALNLLRTEGVIVKKARGSEVAPAQDPRVLGSGTGGIVGARMPSEAERRRYGLPVGVPVLVVLTARGEIVLPANRYAIRVPGDIDWENFGREDLERDAARSSETSPDGPTHSD